MTLTKKQNHILTTFKEYFLITLGEAIYCFGFVALIVKANTVPGGAGGISSLIYYALGEPSSWLLGLGNIYFMVNLVLLIAGFFVIGPRFGVKTIYAICLASVLLNIYSEVLPPDVMGLSAEAGDQLLMAILGGVLCGVGVGMCLMQGGSTGGTDIIAMIVGKYHNVSFGRVLMLCDFVIITSSVFILTSGFRPAIYGFVVLATVGYTIDMVLSGSRQSTQITIFSSKHKEIGDRIMTEANRGITYLHGEGGYTAQQQKVIIVVCRKTEQGGIYKIIKEVDPNAFITSAAVSGAYGAGFEVLRVRKSQGKS